MDVRDGANPVLERARRWLAQVNARHPWDHNEHFHGWILGNLPARRRVAVDVGCGTGVLAGKLAPHFARVTGMLAPGGRLLVVGLARVSSPADLVIDLISAALNPFMGLIKHPRPARPGDGPAAGEPAMPVRDPAATLAQITAAARIRLPGATIRRRLFFRYTLRWDKRWPLPAVRADFRAVRRPRRCGRWAGRRPDSVGGWHQSTRWRRSWPSRATSSLRGSAVTGGRT